MASGPNTPQELASALTQPNPTMIATTQVRLRTALKPLRRSPSSELAPSSLRATAAPAAALTWNRLSALSP